MNPVGGNDKPNLPVEGSLLQRIAPGPSRVLVGVNQFNDENQQNLRIQQAVNRYNGTVLPPYWRPSTAFKCSLYKGKSLNPFSADESGSSDDSRQKPEARYAFPGQFPTVLLGKTQMRPTKKQSILSRLRSNAAGLPVSRFLDDSAEKYSDLKPTRSVLEVLQDLSRKRIHGKDENDESSKRRCKGLGGDLVTEGDVAFQPLFVSKLKNLPKKDQMTQTVSDVQQLNGSPRPESPSRDPKWELRKKLAQKNNEIFASLSSSINNLIFAKRKRVTNTTTLDSEDKSTKKKKVEIPVSASEEGNSAKKRREKPVRKDCGPRSPPTKDRLMSIYFELESNVNSKQDALKAMNNKSEPSQFQRSTPEKSPTTEPPTLMNNPVSSTNGKLQFANNPNPLVPLDDVTNLSRNSTETSDNIQFFKDDSKREEQKTKSEKEKEIATAVNPTSTSTFSFGLTQPEKPSTLTSPRSTPEKGPIGSSPTLQSTNTSSPPHFQFGSKNLSSSPSNKSFNFEALKSSPPPNVNFNASVTPASSSIVSSINPVSSASTVSTPGFTFGGKLPSLGSPSSTFSLSAGQLGSTSISTSSNHTTTVSSPTFGISQLSQNVMTSSGSKSPYKINSSPTQKLADTSTTFSFGNAKPATAATATPSTFSLGNTTTEKAPSAVANHPPTFSFGQSDSTLKPFSFGAKGESENKKSPAKPENSVNKPNENLTFGKTNWVTSSNDGKDKKSSDKASYESPIFGNPQQQLGTDISSSKVKEVSKSIPTFGASNQESSVFSRLGSVVNSNQKLASTYAVSEGTKKEQNQNVLISQNEAPSQPVFGTSKPLNDSNIFAGGAMFSGISKSDPQKSSSPLFGQVSTTTSSGAFTFGSNDKPSFQFGQSSANVSVGTETKPFSFGLASTAAPSSNDTVKKSLVSTATSQSIFSFGTEKTKEDTPIFSFGNTVASSSNKPFTFGNSGDQQKDMNSSTSASPNVLVTATQSFESTFNNQGGNENKTSSKVESTPAAAIATSPAMFGAAKTATSIFSAASGFGTTTSATSGFSFGATNSVLPTATTSTTASSGFSGTFVNTSSTLPPTAPPGFREIVGRTNSAFSTAPAEFSGTFGSSNPTTTTSTPTGFSGTFGATNSIVPTTSTPTFESPAFGTSTSAHSAFGSTAGFGSTSSAPPTFGNTTGFTTTSAPPTFGSTSGFGATTSTFGTTTSTPSAFGIATTFGATTAAPTAFSSTSTFGTTATPGFGSDSVFGSATSSALPFGSSAAVTTTSAPSFGSGTTFGSTTSGFGSSMGTSTTTPSFGTLGAANTSNNTQSFGNTTGTAFGIGNALGTHTTAANTGNAFGALANPPSFGNTGTVFGNNNATFGNSVTPPTFGSTPSPAPFTGNTTQSFGNVSSFGSNPSSATTNAFGNSSPARTFGFGTPQASSPPSFNFGSTTASSGPANTSFNFGSGSTGGSGSASSSVFSFGANSAANNAKPFCFGANTSGFPQSPTPGSSGLSQLATPGTSGFQAASPFTPAPFSVPGTFSIGSGSTQPRSRTAARFRRRT